MRPRPPDRRARRRAGALLAGAVLVAGCVVDGPDDTASTDRAPLTPTFAPDTSAAATSPSSSEVAAAPAAQPVPAASPGAPATPAATPPPAAPVGAPARGVITDPVGDVTASALDRPPTWADLGGGTLTRAGDRFELAVRLGAPAPSGAPDPDHTMNVAAFFDLDGDGSVDTEVWANLASEGWGGAWFDNDSGAARYVDESAINVTVEGGLLVLRFPASHVRGAEAFRWSLASEWGRYAVIGTSAAARDDAPDGDVPVGFPQ